MSAAAMAEDNAAVARRWFEEVWNQRRWQTVEELLVATSVAHLETGDVIGPEGFKAPRAALLDAFPDLHLQVEDLVWQGEKVLVRWSVAATHGGDGLGIRATGRRVSIQGMSLLLIRDGKILEGWDSWNLGGLLTSLQAPAA